jgi:hypothetical protein
MTIHLGDVIISKFKGRFAEIDGPGKDKIHPIIQPFNRLQDLQLSQQSYSKFFRDLKVFFATNYIEIPREQGYFK